MKYRLVIIDDEKKILEGICNLFPWNEIGFQVVQAFTDAKKGWAYIEENGADVILTDIEMPGMSGLELCRKLAEYREIRVVLFSSYTNNEYFQFAIRLGVDDYLIKPVRYEQLLECFERVREKLNQRYSQPKTLSDTYYDQMIDKVREYLLKNYRHASLEEASSCVNLSPAYLSKVFKEKSGMNFSQMLLNVRMEKACELLNDPRYKMYDIAFYVGYENPKNFSRAFKARFQVSPMEYRKKLLEGEAEDRE